MRSIETFILGCGNFGGVGSTPALRGCGEIKDQAFALLDHAKKLGINKFDTANAYGVGLSETFLGEWITKQGANYRSKIEIHTKVGNPHGIKFGQAPLSEKEINYHLSNSLARLKTSYVDLYYLHEPDPKTPIDETTSALLEAIRAQKIRNIGLSNVSIEYVKQFIASLGSENIKHLYGVQNEFNYLNQGDSKVLIPYLKSLGLKYIAFSPLAGGLLSGKYDLGKPFPLGSRLSLLSEPYRNLLTEETFDKIERLKEKAKSRQRFLSEEAIQFLVESEETDFIIIGPRKKEHYASLGFKFE